MAFFWRSLSLLGSVGWPIALGALGGVLLGRIADSRYGSWGTCSLCLLCVGLALGSLTAWHLVRHPGK